jgi:hypothetical protein
MVLQALLGIWLFQDRRSLVFALILKVLILLQVLFAVLAIHARGPSSAINEGAPTQGVNVLLIFSIIEAAQIVLLLILAKLKLRLGNE